MNRDRLLRRLIPFATAGLLLAMMAALWCGGALGLYYHIIALWGVSPHASPFLDTDMVLSAIRCRQAGMDVYVANPCDQISRVYDYPPLWLVLAYVPGLGDWLTPIGFGCDLAFLGALLALPPGHTRRDALLIAAGAVSSASMFALERGNNDLLIFTVAALAADLSCRSRAARYIGYALALLAGLLKYYPMALLALATREPPRRLIVVALCAAAAVATMVAVMGHDLARALALIPTGDYIGDMFGSSTLAGGLYGTFATAGAPGRIVLQAAMTIAALAIAAWQGTRPARAIELAALDARERAFLIAGAMLVLGCFFTAQNIGYRTIHLILALPALTALRRAGPPGSRYGWTVAAILLLLWSQGWRLLVHLGAGYFPPVTGLAIEIMAWLVREALWWWTVTMLATLALALLSRSEAAEAMLAALPRPLRAIAN